LTFKIQAGGETTGQQVNRRRALKGRKTKLRSVALSGLAHIWSVPVVSPPATICCASGAKKHFLSDEEFQFKKL
jgi:hypothetical protein